MPGRALNEQTRQRPAPGEAIGTLPEGLASSARLRVMSAFKRRAPANRPALPTGARASPYTGASLVSLGVSSLDDVLGGGLPLGSVCLLEEDAGSSYAELLLRFWLAQGLCCPSHRVLLASARAGELASSLMAPDESTQRAVATAESDDEASLAPTDMKIAFRYAGLAKVDKPAPRTVVEEAYCSTFDLTRTYKLSEAQRARLHTNGDHDEAFFAALEAELASLRSCVDCARGVLSRQRADERLARSSSCTGRSELDRA